MAELFLTLLGSKKGSAQFIVGAMGMMIMLIVIFVVIYMVAKPIAQQILEALGALFDTIR